MDPDAAYESWAIAVERGDRSSANEFYNNLRVWIERGGFEPSAWSDHVIRRQFFGYNPRSGKPGK